MISSTKSSMSTFSCTCTDPDWPPQPSTTRVEREGERTERRIEEWQYRGEKKERKTESICKQMGRVAERHVLDHDVYTRDIIRSIYKDGYMKKYARFVRTIYYRHIHRVLWRFLFDGWCLLCWCRSCSRATVDLLDHLLWTHDIRMMSDISGMLPELEVRVWQLTCVMSKMSRWHASRRKRTRS